MKFIAVLFLTFITLNIQAKTCSNGTYLVQKHPRQSYYRNDATHVSATTVSSYCRNYRDDEPLQPQFRTRFPKGWPHKKEQFKKCSKAKQQQISKILYSIPKILTDVGKLKIYCANRSYISNNPAASSPEAKIIVLYNSSFKMDTKRVIVHELAHILWSRLSNKEKSTYQDASNWSLVAGVYIYNRTKFSEPDGKNGPEEDFANNIEHYFANPSKIKKEFPSIYTWIDTLIRNEK